MPCEASVALAVEPTAEDGSVSAGRKLVDSGVQYVRLNHSTLTLIEPALALWWETDGLTSLITADPVKFLSFED